MNTRLIWVTPDAEKTMCYCARVSNPANQDSLATGLLSYCIKNHHWSVFEMANMCVEIVTTRAIAQQILRHRSFSFQEFSQRYAEALEWIPTNPREQDTKNRQNSTDTLKKKDIDWFRKKQDKLATDQFNAYDEAIKRGIAKECARFLLPSSTQTKIYMSGTVRSWIHYLGLRSSNGTQLEHKEIADEIKKIFDETFPVIAKALDWL